MAKGLNHAGRFVKCNIANLDIGSGRSYIKSCRQRTEKSIIFIALIEQGAGVLELIITNFFNLIEQRS